MALTDVTFSATDRAPSGTPPRPVICTSTVSSGPIAPEAATDPVAGVEDPFGVDRDEPSGSGGAGAAPGGGVITGAVTTGHERRDRRIGRQEEAEVVDRPAERRRTRRRPSIRR